MSRYHFITDLRLSVDTQRVWEVVSDPEPWPAWWRWLKRVDLLERGDESGVGARLRYEFGTALPYTISFDTEVVRIVRPRLIESRASGDLEGWGVFQLAADDGGSRLTYNWLVETTKRWMNMLTLIGRPVFSWNHDVLMRDFARGIAAKTDASLLAVENTTVKPGQSGFYQLPPS